MNKKIIIFGGGWLGKRIAFYFKNKGFSISASTNNEIRKNELENKGIQVYPFEKLIEFSFDDSITLVIICIATNGNTKKYLNSIAQIVKKLKSNAFKSPCVLMSTTGLYGEEEICTENSKVVTNHYFQAEEIIREYNNHFIFRLGGLIGDDRNPLNFFKTDVLENYNQNVNLVHYSDICSAVESVMESLDNFGTYNICYPADETKYNYYNQVRALNNRKLLKKGKESNVLRKIDAQKFISTFDFKYKTGIYKL